MGLPLPIFFRLLLFGQAHLIFSIDYNQIIIKLIDLIIEYSYTNINSNKDLSEYGDYNIETLTQIANFIFNPIIVLFKTNYVLMYEVKW